MIFENSLPKANFKQNIRDSPNGSLTADSRSLQTASLKHFTRRNLVPEIFELFLVQNVFPVNDMMSKKPSLTLFTAFAPSFCDENLKLIGAKHDSFKKKKNNTVLTRTPKSNEKRRKACLTVALY